MMTCDRFEFSLARIYDIFYSTRMILFHPFFLVFCFNNIYHYVLGLYQSHISHWKTEGIKLFKVPMVAV